MTTHTLTLTDFLLARIAEDEDRASLVTVQSVDTTSGVPQIRHTAIRDRVLAECEAKRRIIEAHPLATDVVPVHTGPNPGSGCETCHTVTAASVFDPDYVEALGPCDTLLALAAIYSAHPDYRPEWRP